MSACLVSSVPRLDSHMSFIDLCCLFAEETSDKVQHICQQQQQQHNNTTAHAQEAAPRAQLTHLNNALGSLIATMQQLHATVAGWRAEEDEEDDEEAEEREQEQERAVEVDEEEEEVEVVEVEAEADKENDRPVLAQPALSECKPAMEPLTADTVVRPQCSYSILASPAHFDSRPHQRLTQRTPSFATPATNSTRGRVSGGTDGGSATHQQANTPRYTPTTSIAMHLRLCTLCWA